VKPDRRQKNKGYQSLPPEFCDSGRGGCATIPRRNSVKTLFHTIGRRLDFDDKSRKLG
jgi:hypothetical protein